MRRGDDKYNEARDRAPQPRYNDNGDQYRERNACRNDDRDRTRDFDRRDRRSSSRDRKRCKLVKPRSNLIDCFIKSCVIIYCTDRRDHDDQNSSGCSNNNPSYVARPFQEPSATVVIKGLPNHTIESTVEYILRLTNCRASHLRE